MINSLRAEFYFECTRPNSYSYWLDFPSNMHSKSFKINCQSSSLFFESYSSSRFVLLTIDFCMDLLGAVSGFVGSSNSWFRLSIFLNWTISAYLYLSNSSLTFLSSDKFKGLIGEIFNEVVYDLTLSFVFAFC